MLIESPHALNFQPDVVYYMVNFGDVELSKMEKRDSKYIYEFKHSKVNK